MIDARKDKSEIQNIKPAVNGDININMNLQDQNHQNEDNTGIDYQPQVEFNPNSINVNNDEIKTKIMNSKYCYIKQDLESFFSACVGCCSDSFKYKVYVSQNQIDEIYKMNDAIFRVHENEDCCMRFNFCCSKICKSESLFLYPIKSDNLYGHFSYPCCPKLCCNYSCECCYRLGPPSYGYFCRSEDTKYGEIDERSHWFKCLNLCCESHQLFDKSKKSRLIIEKRCCQLSDLLYFFFLSGVYPLEYDIIYNEEVVGNIIRSAKACCCGTKLYYFEIEFPKNSTFEERMLLIGFALREYYLHYSQIVIMAGLC